MYLDPSCTELMQESVSGVGCNLDEVRGLIQCAQMKAPGKSARAVIEWIWCDVCDVASAQAAITGVDILDPRWSFLLAGKVVYDNSEQSLLGHSIQTTTLVGFYENAIFETRNTSYILVGSGSRLVFRDPELLPAHLLN